MKKSFTLIELLIVIAIIAILLSILLPSLSKAREKAYLSVCLSNHSQINRALTIYATHNNNHMPDSNKKYGSWLIRNSKFVSIGYLVRDELIDPRLMYCPTWTHPVANYNKMSSDKKYGGLQENRNKFPKKNTWTGTSYRQYPNIKTNYKPINLHKNEHRLAITADHWTKRKNNDFGWDQGNGAFGHNEGLNYISSYLDGSASILYDKPRKLIKRSVVHSYHTDIELMWAEFFDKE